MIRTRQIIKNISYDELVQQQVIPDIYPLVTTENKRYPPFVYKTKDFSYFGVLADFIIRAGLRINLSQEVDLGTEEIVEFMPTFTDELMITALEHINTYQTSTNINDIINSVYFLAGSSRIELKDIQSYIPTYVNIIKEIIAKWNYYITYLSGKVIFNSAYSYESFQGHPDVVINGSEFSTVLDIKNTIAFDKMAKESILQVLAYYALMKVNGLNPRFVGFILPMQRDILLYDLNGWDSTNFLNLLTTKANKLLQPKPEELETMLSGILSNLSLVQKHQVSMMSAGSHIAKGNNIVITLRNYLRDNGNVPCQMFLSNTRSGKRSANTERQIPEAAQIIKENNMLYFTHSPYVINLCANMYDEKTGYWQQNVLNEDLRQTVLMGGRGVVVHTGNQGKLDLDTALNTMEHMIRQALPYATEQCPLLLETPSGQGTETLTKIEELGGFFYRFTEEERKRFGVCIDTAHVQALGYDPYEYLQHWEKYCKIPIKLVHFNDLVGDRGCRVDRHALPGMGSIGMERMSTIAKWCDERKIPMVKE